jgi:UDP-N-acetylglucosamine/UDP-N-acetylgalactosamine diphosphorylase
MAVSYDEARTIVEANEQTQLLRFHDKLSDDEESQLIAQINDIDFAAVAKMREELRSGDAAGASHDDIEPAPVVGVDELTHGTFAATGEQVIRDGKVAVLLVAGGQGTRLGFDGPKGTYPVAPMSNASLFEIHARKILALETLYCAEVPFYIMTSIINNQATVDFFKENDYFGLSADRVKFFVQGTLPALMPDGQMILDTPSHIFVSPDGHGGTLTALDKSGMLADMESRGINAVFFFQVDNPLVEIADPAFIGLHTEQAADMSVKVCAKRDPNEGLGVTVQKDNTVSIVEYTELTDAQKNETLDDGELRFKFGSVAIHIFSLPFLKKEAEAGLPLHRAHKKVPFCDDAGNTVKPDKPNAVKFEKFIFDALPHADKVTIVEFLREEEFSPLKNADGNDSPATVSRDMTLKFARQLEQCGIDVPGSASDPTIKIEIDPCYALNAAQLKTKLPGDFKIEGDVLLK